MLGMGMSLYLHVGASTGDIKKGKLFVAFVSIVFVVTNFRRHSLLSPRIPPILRCL
jgi:hypothetical protein